ncbi:MAG: hypothetical protein JSS64_02080 [Bacteroidetes bacterium]|nr:hypothetical protein [Bacteroidota bacterium]
MESRFLLVAVVIMAAITFFSCKKKEDVVCYTPKQAGIQGKWKQDYFLDPLAFQPLPEWEKIEFRNDSFYMNIRIWAEHLTALDCYQQTWIQYQKGIYKIDNDTLYMNGVITDSNYVLKIGGCHNSGNYMAHFGINYCGEKLILRIPIYGSTISEYKLLLNMFRAN